MAIEIKQQKNNNTPIIVILILIIIIGVGYFIFKDFFRLQDFIRAPKPEEVLPSKEATQLSKATLDINKISNDSLFQVLTSHIQWPLPPVQLGKTNIFKP